MESNMKFEEPIESKSEQKSVYLEEILKNTKSPETKELLLDSADGKAAQAVLYGLKPACWLNQDSADLIKGNIILDGDFDLRGNVLFNRHLVVEVIKSNPEYFQNQMMDADSIIDDYFNSGKDEGQVSIQFGLLMGFPKKECEFYRKYNGKTKDLPALEIDNIIPKDSADLELCRSLSIKQSEYFKISKNNGDHPFLPPDIAEKVKYLLYKYLSKETADLSWERYQGKFINAEGIFWIEKQSTPEGEEIKKKYRSAFGNENYKMAVEKELDKLCSELVNNSVKKTLNEKNIVEIKSLAKEIKSKYSNNTRAIKLSSLLSNNFNTINSQPISSADDLIQYLKMQKETYKKETK